jgi:hypothetical protein
MTAFLTTIMMMMMMMMMMMIHVRISIKSPRKPEILDHKMHHALWFEDKIACMWH